MSNDYYQNMDAEGGSRFEKFKSHLPARVTIARIAYGMFLLIAFVLALLLRAGLFGAMANTPYLKDACVSKTDAAGNQETVCFSAVYRISFGCALFYFIHMLLASRLFCVKPSIKLYLQYKWFALKVLLWLALIVGVWFIPTSFYDVYAWVAMVGAGLFLIVQMIVLIDFAFSWNESWISKETHERLWKALILVCALVLAAVGLVLIILQYIYFGAGADCHLNRFFITFTLVMAIGYTIGSLLTARGLLPPTVLFAYTAWVCWSAVLSDPDKHCNSMFGTGTSQNWTIAIGTIVAALSLFRTAVSTGGSSSSFMSAKKEEAAAGDEEEEEKLECSKMFYAHVVFFLTSFYLAMNLTSWNNQSINKTDEFAIDESLTSLWIKIVSQWITVLLFVWALVAPKLLKNREF